MINIITLLEAIDFQPNDNDEYELHKYLNEQLNGTECEHSDPPFRIPKYFKNLLKQLQKMLE